MVLSPSFSASDGAGFATAQTVTSMASLSRPDCQRADTSPVATPVNNRLGTDRAFGIVRDLTSPRTTCILAIGCITYPEDE